MNDNVYAVSEVVGSSSESIEDAIHNAIKTASKTLHGLDWFEVIETRGHIEGSKIAHYQVSLKLGFRYQ